MNICVQGSLQIAVFNFFWLYLEMLGQSYSMFKVRQGGGEKIPLVQGKKQWLHFAGADVKRYPMSKVRETQGRQ